MQTDCCMHACIMPSRLLHCTQSWTLVWWKGNGCHRLLTAFGHPCSRCQVLTTDWRLSLVYITQWQWLCRAKFSKFRVHGKVLEKEHYFWTYNDFLEMQSRIGWRNVWSMKWRVPGQEVDQRKLGERLWKRTAEHMDWIRRMPWFVVDGESRLGWLMTTMSVSGWMFLLVTAHPGCPVQIPQSRKTVVCVCVCYH